MEVERIRLIRDEVSIWLVYAGRGRRYFDLFRDKQVIFLNLPAFSAVDGVFQSDERIRRHLHMSNEIYSWLSGTRKSAPSRRPSSYSPHPHTSGSSEAKSFNAEVGNIIRMFDDAKPGDLVLSPPMGHYDPFLVGEIRGSWKKGDELEVPFLQGELVPTRRVRWLNSALARRDFPARVSRKLQNQHAITRLDPEYYEEIFDLVYPSYVWGDRSKLDVFGDNYKGTDPLQTYHSAKLVKYVSASVFAFMKGEFDEFQELEIDHAIATYYDEELIEEFGQNFNSPGKFSIVAALGAFGILASAGMIVATDGAVSGITGAQDEAREAVGNAMVGPGKSSQQDILDDYVSSMKATKWNEVRANLGRPSNDTLPLSLSNKVEVATHRAELDAR